MSKKALKKRNLIFFETVIYGILFWIFLSIAILSTLMVLIAKSEQGTSTALIIVMIVIPVILSLAIAIIKKNRQATLSKKLRIKVENLPYTESQIKHAESLECTEDIKTHYIEMCQKFVGMSKSKMQDVVTSKEKNDEKRSATDYYITTAKAKLTKSICPVVYYDNKVPMLLDTKGKPFYLFPLFVLKIGGKKDICAFSYKDFLLYIKDSSYIMGFGEPTPKDAQVTGRAYKYSNKDGSPDLRVKDNPSTEIIDTASLSSPDNNIYYELSNVEATHDFHMAFLKFVACTLSTQMGSESEPTTEKSVVSDTKNLSNPATNNKSKQSDSPFEELNSLVGLAEVKSEIQSLANFVQIQQERAKLGLRNSSVSYHLVFTGNPGTGKTTIARIIASIYRDLKILKKGHLVETDRSGLVAEYLGQTAVKTNSIIDQALDGVLFIDEAYTLSDEKDSYGKEAIATLLKRMEDDRDRLVVILAGYTDNMKKFISSNPGLESRFNRYINFPDYSESELLEIFLRKVSHFDYKIEEDAIQSIQNSIHEKVSNKDILFGNARFVRNLFESVLTNQANRLAENQGQVSKDSLLMITKEDCTNL